MRNTKYWRCEEFFDDTALTEAYIRMYPEAFAGMRQYVMRTDNISCWFYWSDDIPEDVIKEAKEDGRLDPDWNGAKPIWIPSDEDDLEYYKDLIIKSNPDVVNPYDYLDYVIEQETIEIRAEATDFLRYSFLEPDLEKELTEGRGLNHIYIEKKPEEEFNNTQFYDRIRAAIQPENKGGLPFPKRECVSDKLMLSNGTVFDRRAARESALAGGV